jgi:Raf kinase inhibitor-like YbhB/YbcL family protein
MTRTPALFLIVSALLASSSVAAMTLTSTDIVAGGAIPAAQIYPRCGGRNISPQLAWSGVPRAAKSLVLTMIDIDVKPAQWSHWIVVGLPTTASSLAQGTASLPGNAKALTSNFGDAAYAGPCPPKGTGVHHYQFTIWALPGATLDLQPDQKADEVTARLSRQAIDHASLVGWVQAP